MNIINELFRSNNIVYHYTKIQTAYEHILDLDRIKLSERKTSNDPIENITIPNISTSFYGYEKTKYAETELIDKVREFILNKTKNAKQSCFCLNDLNPEFDNAEVVPFKYYGFLKPRMWEQYGDNYNGICLAFDLEKLKEKNKSIYSKQVKYIDYELFHSNSKNIDTVNLHNKGIEKYCHEYYEIIKRQSLLKHLDYSGENEYRFISFTENEKFISIKDCLKAIVISERNISPFAREWVNTYAEKNNIELFFISWYDTGFGLMSKKESDDMSKWVKDSIISKR
jgi:hypothetical protein